MKIITRKNNAQIVRKPYWFVTNSCETLEKSIGLMLLVIYNDVILTLHYLEVFVDVIIIKLNKAGITFEFCDIILYTSANLSKILLCVK